ncbi:MAG: hypothetical protein ACNYVW_05180 [Methanosarcinales archaeon]
MTEPSQSGVHDLKRILGVVAHFGVKPVVCINKYDINEAVTEEIEEFCRENGVEIAGKVPFDVSITKAMVAGVPVLETGPKTDEGEAIERMWARINQSNCLTTKSPDV